MPYKKDFEDWADQYLGGHLSRKQELDFEKALESDKILENEFQEHKNITFDLKKLGNRILLRKKLVHVEENEFKKSGAVKGMVWYKWSAAAASIIIISVVTTLFTAGYLSQKRQVNKFNALKMEVEKIKYNQNVLVTDYNNKVRNVVANYGGTSFLISNEGYLITNYHVVASADSLFVTDSKGAIISAELVLASKEFDLALLKITDSEFLKEIKVPYQFSGETGNLGDKIFTMGYPKEDIVYGEGYLSSRSGFMGDTTSYQISIALNPGNSGGPLFNEKGMLVGVISGKQNEKEGVAFAIKSDYISKMIEMTEKSLDIKINLPAKKNLSNQKSKTDLIKELEKSVFQVRVYGA